MGYQSENVCNEMEHLVNALVNNTEEEAIDAFNKQTDLLDQQIVLDCSTLTNHCVCAANFEYFRKPAHVIQCLRKRKCFHCQRYRCMHKEHETVTASTSFILIAAALGKFEVFKYFHRNGCSLETKSGIFELRPLHISITNGHLNVFFYLLAQQVDVNATILSHGTTYSPLMLAVMHKQEDMLRHLLSTRGINLAYRNSMLQSPVLFAVQNNSLDVVNLLLGMEETLLNGSLSKSNTSRRKLHHPCAMLEAIKQDNKLVLESLLDNGCSVDYIFRGYHTETTAVILASVSGAYQCLRVLVDKGADKEPEMEGYTALDWAIHLGWTKCENILKATKEKRCRQQQNTSECCRKRKHDDEENECHCDCSNECDTNISSYTDGQLSSAIEEKVVNVSQGSDSRVSVIETTDRFPIIAIWSFVQWLDVCELLRRLVKQGHNVDIQDRLGRTSLHMAVEEQNVPGLRTLLQFGANAELRDSCLATPLWHAVFWNKESMIQELMFANVNTDCYAKEDAHRIGLPWAQFNYPVQNSENQKPRSVLYIAVKKNFCRTVKKLLESGYVCEKENLFEILTIAKPATRDILQKHINEPKPLFTLVRNFVRKHSGANIHSIVERSDLPCRINDCLLLRDLFDLKIEPALVHV